MKQSFIRTLVSLILVALLLLQPMGLALAKNPEAFDPNRVSVAILSFPYATADKKYVEAVAAEVRATLEKIPYFRVVDAATVKRIANYHADAVQKNQTWTSAEKYLGLAKAHWFDREYAEAESTVNQAIKLLQNQAHKKSLQKDALLTKALIYQETKRHHEAEKLFREVLALDPALTMAGLPIKGKTRRVFQNTQKSVLAKNVGQLEIKTDPPAAQVYLNGMPKGPSPLMLEKLPPGSYLLTLEASHYQTIHQPVFVAASTTQYINKKLHWLRGRSRNVVGDFGIPLRDHATLQQEINRAIKIGETLKVDKVILLATEKGDKGEMIVARTIDTALKAAYNPIAVSLTDVVRQQKGAALTLAGGIEKQAKKHVLDNPAKYLETHTGDIRMLLRKKPFFKTPLFYSLVGAVIGGAIGTTVGILAAGNDSSSSGGDVGGIEVEFE